MACCTPVATRRTLPHDICAQRACTSAEAVSGLEPKPLTCGPRNHATRRQALSVLLQTLRRRRKKSAPRSVRDAHRSESDACSNLRKLAEHASGRICREDAATQLVHVAASARSTSTPLSERPPSSRAATRASSSGSTIVILPSRSCCCESLRRREPWRRTDGARHAVEYQKFIEIDHADCYKLDSVQAARHWARRVSLTGTIAARQGFFTSHKAWADLRAGDLQGTAEFS
jgi:hypothetical protein